MVRSEYPIRNARGASREKKKPGLMLRLVTLPEYALYERFPGHPYQGADRQQVREGCVVGGW